MLGIQAGVRIPDVDLVVGIGDHFSVVDVPTDSGVGGVMSNCVDSIILSSPPVGNVEALVNGRVSFIRWAPGNGMIYQAVVVPVEDEIKKWMGGPVLVSVLRRDGNRYAAYPCQHDGVFHISYVEEKWGKDLGEEGTYYTTALLNWALRGEDLYAREIYEEARARWQ